jgi:hypothetical protein
LGLIVLFLYLLIAFKILYKTRAAGKRILAKTATQSRQKVAVFALSNFIFRLFFGISQAFCTFLVF